MNLDEVVALISPEGEELLKKSRLKKLDSFLSGFKVSSPLIRAVAEQISIAQKLKNKLPTFAKAGALSERDLLEQATVEPVAKFRASIMSGETLLDGTGGVGVDAFASSTSFNETTICEIEEKRAKLLAFNSEKMGLNSIEIVNENSIEYLKKSDKKFSWIFLDPARRSSGKRFIELSNYSPDIIFNGKLLRESCDCLAVKISPAFDISQLRKLVPDITSIRVMSYKSEVREVFFTVESTGGPFIEAVLLDDNGEVFFYVSDSLNSEKKNTELDDLKSDNYLYEPDPAIIKADLVDKLALILSLKKVSQRGVFLTGVWQEGFPGRVLKIVGSFEWSRKSCAHYLRENKISSATIVRRDFPLSVAELRKQFKLRESGNRFLIFTVDRNNQKVVIDAIRD